MCIQFRIAHSVSPCSIVSNTKLLSPLGTKELQSFEVVATALVE